MEYLYGVLGLSISATDAEVKAKYRRLVLGLHPDKHPGDKGKLELFNAVTFAYQTITDSDKRAAYLSGQSSSSHLSPAVEEEQRRAADNVYVTAMHFMFSDDDNKRRRSIAAHYLSAETLPDKDVALSTVLWKWATAGVADSCRSLCADAATVSVAAVRKWIAEEWPTFFVLVLVWCGVFLVA